MPSTRQMSVSCAEVEFILSPPKDARRASNVPQGAWHARSLQSKYAAAASSASRVHRWHRARTLEAQCRGPGWHLICICRPPKPYRQRTLGVHRRALHARVCYVPAGDAAHTAVIAHCSITPVIAHCSITPVCSLRAPVSLKTRTGDVRRRYGHLRFGYRIRRRPAAERCTADCDRGLNKAIIGSDNGLSPAKDQAIIWTHADL